MKKFGTIICPRKQNRNLLIYVDMHLVHEVTSPQALKDFV